MNFTPNEPKKVIEDFVVKAWSQNTIFNHYESPLYFMDDVVQYKNTFPDGTVPKLIKDGVDAYSKVGTKDVRYNKLYEDVARKVKDKLIARGFTTALLYRDVGFTSQKTGVLSKQRVLLGKRDCYFKDTGMSDGKLFHDIYINLSYGSEVADNVIEKNAYALYALTKELSKVIPMRVFVVNHVGTKTPICYSYVLKKFGMAITPEEFLFFTNESKRTFGFAMYNIMRNGYRNSAEVGTPPGTASIANFNLDKEIDNIFNKVKTLSPELFEVQ